MKRLLNHLEEMLCFYLSIALVVVVFIAMLSMRCHIIVLEREQTYVQIAMEGLPEDTRQQIFNRIIELKKQHKNNPLTIVPEQ